MAFKLAVFLMLGSILASWGTYIYDNYRFLTTTTYKKIFCARSKCDHCEKQLKYINLIPFFSYIFQRGKSSCCNKPISRKYFYIESLGILVGAIMAFFDQISVGLLISLLIFLIFLDERYKEIPITLNLLIIILVTISIPNISLNNYVAPLIVMAFLLLIYFGFLLIKKKEGVGLGDIILIFSISLFIGFPNILYLITIASSLLLLKIIFTQKYKEQHAFGSWLAGVFLTFILFQEFYVFEGSVTI